MRHRNQRELTVAAASAQYLVGIAAMGKALHYARTAQRDEKSGSPYCAAMQWRHAAELVGESTVAADYFWQQWERVMQLPRRLANPIG